MEGAGYLKHDLILLYLQIFIAFFVISFTDPMDLSFKMTIEFLNLFGRIVSSLITRLTELKDFLLNL